MIELNSGGLRIWSLHVVEVVSIDMNVAGCVGKNSCTCALETAVFDVDITTAFDRDSKSCVGEDGILNCQTLDAIQIQLWKLFPPGVQHECTVRIFSDRSKFLEGVNIVAFDSHG